MTTATTSYRPTARALHWIVALLVISTIPVGVAMTQEGLPRNIQDTLFIYHKNVGVIIFLLVLARLIFRAFNPAPPLPATMPGWQVNAAKASHALLYALLLVMTISGYVRVVAGDFPIEGLDALSVPRFIAPSEDLAETAKAIHFYVRFPLVGLILLHIGAALHHAIVRRDGVFSRMLPSSGR